MAFKVGLQLAVSCTSFKVTLLGKGNVRDTWYRLTSEHLYEEPHYRSNVRDTWYRLTSEHLYEEPHYRSAQVWHAFSMDHIGLPAHSHVYPRTEWTIYRPREPPQWWVNSLQGRYVADIVIVSCLNRHASLGKWVYTRLLPQSAVIGCRTVAQYHIIESCDRRYNSLRHWVTQLPTQLPKLRKLSYSWSWFSSSTLYTVPWSLSVHVINKQRA